MSLDDFKETKITNGIRKVYPMILCAVGLIGNILALGVLCRARNRNTTTGVLLIALAITDIVVLITSVLFLWLSSTLEIDLRNYSTGSCKFLTFLAYFTIQLSAWILVVITSERVYSVTFPHRVKDLVTRKRIIIVLLVLIVALAGLNSHLLYGMRYEYSEAYNKTICRVTPTHVQFMFQVWPWIDFCVSFALPAILFVVGNTLIIAKLRSSSRYHSSMHSADGHANNSNRLQHRISKRVTSFTLMSLVLNVTFFLLMAPFSIYAIGQPYWFPHEGMPEQRHVQLILIATILLMLTYTNNAVNFIIYILGGTKFRKDFVATFCCCRRKRGFSSDRSATDSTKLTSLATSHL